MSQSVLLGTMAPQAAADRLEQGLKGWYAPHQGQQAKAVDCQCTAPAAVSAAPATVEASVATSSAAISTALSASPCLRLWLPRRLPRPTSSRRWPASWKHRNPEGLHHEKTGGISLPFSFAPDAYGW